MKAIWKFAFTSTGEFSIDIPGGAEILCVHIHYGVSCLYVLLDTGNTVETRTFVVHGTGHPVSSSENKKYIGTYQESGGDLVWHLFELMEASNGD